MILLDCVCRVLTRHGIAHALIGAAALAARGIARSTFDIDLLTTDARVLDGDLWTSLTLDDVAVVVRRGDEADPLGGVVRFDAQPERPVDIIMGKYSWQTRVVDRADRMPSGPPVVRAADLILLKLYAGGTQDLWDVRELLRLPDAEHLIAQVNETLEDLPPAVRRLWLETSNA